MATVSILLCLVLISTSVLSGIFAKYVITKKGSASATFKTFGVTLEMTVDETKLRNADATVNKTEDVHKVTKSVTITGLKMAPGVELDKIINIKLSGTPTVNCRFKLDIELDFDTAKFIIPIGECGVTANGENSFHFPVRFSLGRPDTSGYVTSNIPLSSVNTAIGGYEVDLFNKIASFALASSVNFKGIGGDYIEAENKYVNTHLYRDFSAGETIYLHPSKSYERVDGKLYFTPDETFSFNEFDLGLNWPFTCDGNPIAVDNNNARDTYIIDHNPGGIDFTYKVTVSVEQIIPE
jgi:hypothetical protein